MQIYYSVNEGDVVWKYNMLQLQKIICTRGKLELDQTLMEGSLVKSFGNPATRTKANPQKSESYRVQQLKSSWSSDLTPDRNWTWYTCNILQYSFYKVSSLCTY